MPAGRMRDTSRTGEGGYLRRRWSGQVPVASLFWREMMFGATPINLLAGAVALLIFAEDGPIWLATAVLLLPVPWNGFLLLALWRHAQAGVGMRLAGLAWFVAMIFV
jgi:hypothetical protein